MDRRNTVVWSFFDFATTPVAFAVNAMYLPLLVISLGGSNFSVGVLPLVTGIVAAIWTPILGTYIDKSEMPNRTRKGVVFLSSLFACISIIILANSGSLTDLLLSFTTMSISIQSGWTAMNSYLATEGQKGRMGSLSGFGITMGYFGGAIGAGGALLIELLSNRTLAMMFVAIFLFFFAIIPSFFLTEHSESKVEISSLMDGLKAGGKEMWKNSSVRAYLVGSILWGDAISTVVTFASIIAIEVLYIPTVSVTFFLATALPAAMVGAFIQGKAGDRFSLIRLQRINLILWMVGILLVIVGG
ncbi:MAG: MFS transporter, partial [Candidatus Thorarchaeota archaeon]